MIRRRVFIAGFASVAFRPFTARAQDAGRMRRIGALINLAADDPESRRRETLFVQGMQELGWTDGRNMRIDFRWGAGDAGRLRRYAAELVALAPDVILAHTSTTVAALQQLTETIPIVFVGVIDPVGAGFVESLGRPGGNSTGFVAFEYALAAKWLELLKEMAPRVTRAAVLRDPTFAAGIGQFAAIQAVGPIGIELSAVDARDVGAIERGVAAFARGSNGGLVVTAAPFGTNHPKVMTALAARYNLPTVYPFRYYASAGGLLSYGPDAIGQFRSAASYVDRILKGETPANLPVQAPTKYELVINLETAKALGLIVPQTLLATADEVIQ